ncbi:calmodulin-like 3 [Tritrichomonas musculus]|uniref:Calmodulin-like 3 n=1 Tax=Tritrichomonas musculus TaxID=1915356 RepID=A0ABR2L1I7_9EUKA
MSDSEPSFKQLTEAEIADARQQFTIIDTDRNGSLTEDELDSYFRQSKQELRCFPKLVVELYGSNGTVSVDQYLKFYKALSADRDSNEYIGRYIFDHIDHDHNGTIEASEYQKVASLIKLPPGMEQQTINKADKMDYAAFSKHFYTLLRMAWRRILH